MKALNIFCLFLLATVVKAAPPGIIVDYSPASSGLYIGSPSIVILPNGEYLASHDFFGPKSAEFEAPNIVVFKSADRGQSWKKIATVKALFWAGLFVHDDAVYIMGTDRHHGRIVIRRSNDNGSAWTEATDSTHGLLTPRADYHTAPTPVIEHNGRIWRAFEDASGGTQWGLRYMPIMLSAPVKSDLLNATNWTFSEIVKRDTNWLHGKFTAWLEGNAIIDPQNKVVNVLRVEVPSLPEKAAIIGVSDDGKSASFNADRDIVDFPGGAKKFTIRFDPESHAYWSLTSATPKEFQDLGKPNPIRNTFVLMKSENLRDWEIRATLFSHPDAKKHGFQYADWQFDGSDIVAVVRTAFDDDEGGAHNFHDANFMTFHRVSQFRTLR
jgi:hypothetical protein